MDPSSPSSTPVAHPLSERRPCCQACNFTQCVRLTKTCPNAWHQSATLLSRLIIQEITEQRVKVCELGCLLWIIAKLSLHNCCSEVWSHKLQSVGHLSYKVPDQRIQSNLDETTFTTTFACTLHAPIRKRSYSESTTSPHVECLDVTLITINTGASQPNPCAFCV